MSKTLSEYKDLTNYGAGIIGIRSSRKQAKRLCVMIHTVLSTENRAEQEMPIVIH